MKTTAWDLIGHGFSSLAKPPFRTIWMVILLIAVAAPTLTDPGDDLSLVALLVFAVVTFLLEMSAVLAAAETTPDPSADTWIRTALRRRGLWRFVLASILTDMAVGLGLLGFLVGGFVVAGIVGLAPQVALLERKLPLQAFSRSAELTRPARGRVGAVYGLLILIPTIGAVIPYAIGYEPSDTVERIRGVLSSTMTMAAWIALTKAYIGLGGTAADADEAESRDARVGPPL
jgi:hypothetical protein